MPIDYSSADLVFNLAFEKLDKPSAKIDFPKPGTLSKEFSALLGSSNTIIASLPHNKSQMLASASVEMWHRAIHSFLWSVALAETSPLWASVSGYYASHFVMRAFSYSLGIYKSFLKKKTCQVVMNKGQFVLSILAKSNDGEHAFYWKAIKGHPKFVSDDLFRENSERNEKSDSAHRTFANYTDHVDSFTPIKPPSLEKVKENVEKISRIRRHSVTEPSRDDYPDLQNVQILAFQRIVAFHDFLDERIPTNRFWRMHRRPSWCKNIMLYQVEDPGLEAPLFS
ncbi:MAG: hypothetical protein V7641_470 [Blastocatellia bacterium]